MTPGQELFRQFNFYRPYTRSYQSLPFKAELTDKKGTRVRALEAMADWCDERDVQPSLWLYSLFEARYWVYVPRFDHLQSEKHFEKFSALVERMTMVLYEQCLQAGRVLREEPAAFDSWRDLSQRVEHRKRVLGDACLSAIEETWGYHPASNVCKQCPVQDRCRIEVQSHFKFDILALRRGELTLADARRVQSNVR